MFLVSSIACFRSLALYTAAHTHIFSPLNGNAGPHPVSGARKKVVDGGMANPAAAAITDAGWATIFALMCPSSFQMTACSFALSSSFSTNPPCATSFSSIRSCTSASSTKELSAEQEAARSKVLERAILAAASLRSAVLSTVTTALPTPTPSAGVPEEYAASTIGLPPVANTRSHCFMSSLVLGTEGLSTPSTKSAGAPMATHAWRSSPTIKALVLLALGCGATMMLLRPFTAEIALITGVASGLVVGDRAPMTPTGFTIFTRPSSGCSSTTPTDTSSIMSIRVARVLRKIFKNFPS
mmetsp:Transcript_51989/g.96728  ORF Transcript_51989/g.96728 Transcript_51989/m.96728 type:complete len:297 (-) Transcript_51989:330-1220(-)